MKSSHFIFSDSLINLKFLLSDDGTLQPASSNTSSETIGPGTQIQASDKMTVKALLSQLLPHTFQNTGSVLFVRTHYSVACVIRKKKKKRRCEVGP